MFDGTGAAGSVADVGISGKRIRAVGDLSDASANRIINAHGLAVSPGFIDVHCHSDAAILNDPAYRSGILQGVTTITITPDGIGFAPLSRENFLKHRRYLSGILGLPPEDTDTSSISAFKTNYHQRVSCNVAVFAGHGPIRLESAGFWDIPLQGDSLSRALRLLEESLEQGACGFSTGLSYYPQSYSDSEELVQFCKIAAKYGAPFSIHLRNHNTDRAFNGGGVLEAIEVAKRSGVKLHLEHYRTQPDSAGRLDELLAPVEEAKRSGVDMTMETYGYPVGSSHPPQFLPGWVHEGGVDAMVDRLKDRSLRSRLITEMKKQMPFGVEENTWTVMGSQRNANLQGMSFKDVARSKNESVEEMVINVMMEEGLACGFRANPPHSSAVWRQVEADIMELMRRPDYMIGSDSIPVGPLPHPRAAGCFARMLGRLRRRHGIPLELMIQRATQNPAARFGFKDRGVIREGAFADIAMFDADHLNDRSTFDDPNQPPEGMFFVIVNGQIAVDDEVATGVLAGEAIP